MSYTEAFIEAWPRRMEIQHYKFTQCRVTSILKDAFWWSIFYPVVLGIQNPIRTFLKDARIPVVVSDTGQ